jgi:5-hydroxyisourate hydrolase-like protein (transthyretin family)
LKKNLEVVIFELNALNKTIKEYKNNIDKLTTNLSELNNIKYEQKKLLENYISKKEIFEEKAKNLIKIIKNKNNVSDNKENYHVNITLKEIIYNNKNNFIYQLFQTLYAINIINNKKYYNIIKKIIDHAYLELKSEINTNQSLDENIIINTLFF